MICPQCQSENPDSNRFCGNCGNRLTSPQASSPEVSDPGKTTNTTTRRPFIVSTTAMTDAASRTLHSRVMPSPSIASATTYSSPVRAAADPVYHGENTAEPIVAPVDPADEPLFTHARSVEETPVHHEQSELREEETIPVDDTPRADSILGLIAPVITERHDRFAEENAPEADDRFSDLSEAPTAEQEREVSEPAEVPHNPYWQFDEPSSSSSRNVSGPSFLGLGSNEAEYIDEEQPTSHSRGYLFLFVLLIVGVLGALEWRASQNGDSTNPMDVLHLKLPKKKGQGEVVVVPPSSNAPASPAGDTNQPSPDANNGGKPDLVAEPNQSAVQKQPAQPAETNLPPQTGQAAHPSTQQPTPAPAAAETNPAPKSEEPVSANAAPAPSQKPAQTATEIATATPPAKPAAKPVPQPTKPSSEKPRAATKTAPLAPVAPPAEDTALNGGAFELQKGIAAGDNEVGRMWLWKALSKGNGQAPVLLAEMYAQGRGVPKNCDQAMLIMNAAAKKPNVRARSKLGSMYATGECVPMDRVKAYKWMSAALEVNPGSEWITRNRQELLSKMSVSERMRATR